MSATLGSLEKVDPRLAWTKEDQDFTGWLASDAGLKLLGDTLGLVLEREAEEHAVGPFKADILARRTDTPDEHWVIIENQLEKTGHKSPAIKALSGPSSVPGDYFTPAAAPIPIDP